MHPEREIKTFNPYWDGYLFNDFKSVIGRTIEKNTKNDIEAAKSVVENIAKKHNLKVFFEENISKKRLDIYFIDPFNLDKTLYSMLIMDELLDEWPITLEWGVMDRFSRMKNHHYHMDVASLYPTMMPVQKLLTQEYIEKIFGRKNKPKGIMDNKEKETMKIKDVIFNNPATIVLWKDGTKTVVKCGEGDVYDPEKGLAMAIAKKALGNKYGYFDVIDRYTKKYYKGLKRNEKAEEKEEPKPVAKPAPKAPVKPNK